MSYIFSAWTSTALVEQRYNRSVETAHSCLTICRRSVLARRMDRPCCSDRFSVTDDRTFPTWNNLYLTKLNEHYRKIGREHRSIVHRYLRILSGIQRVLLFLSHIYNCSVCVCNDLIVIMVDIYKWYQWKLCPPYGGRQQSGLWNNICCTIKPNQSNIPLHNRKYWFRQRFRRIYYRKRRQTVYCQLQ